MFRPSDEEVFKKDGFRCVYCDHNGMAFDGWIFLQVDHFIPRCRGGRDDITNLYTACISCNHMKGAFVFTSLEEARCHIKQWREQMRTYWEKNVRNLL